MTGSAPLTLQVIADDHRLPDIDAFSVKEARKHVFALLSAGYRGMTAEVIDRDGEVVASYEHGAWTESFL